MSFVKKKGGKREGEKGSSVFEKSVPFNRRGEELGKKRPWGKGEGEKKKGALEIDGGKKKKGRGECPRHTYSVRGGPGGGKGKKGGEGNTALEPCPARQRGKKKGERKTLSHSPVQKKGKKKKGEKEG